MKKPIKLKELIVADRDKKATELINLAKNLTEQLREKARLNGHIN